MTACLDHLILEAGCQLDPGHRQELVPLIAPAVAIDDDVLEKRQAYYAVRWGVTVLGSYVLEVIGDRARARQLREMGDLLNLRTDVLWASPLTLLDYARMEAAIRREAWEHRGSVNMALKFADAAGILAELVRAIEALSSDAPGSHLRAVDHVADAFAGTEYIDFEPIHAQIANFLRTILTMDGSTS